MKPEAGLHGDRDRIYLKRALEHIASERGIPEIQVSDEMLFAARTAASLGVTEKWNPLPPEEGGGGRSDSLGMVFVRRRRQLAYSFKISNFVRDPLSSANATSCLSVRQPMYLWPSLPQRSLKRSQVF